MQAALMPAGGSHMSFNSMPPPQSPSTQPSASDSNTQQSHFHRSNSTYRINRNPNQHQFGQGASGPPQFGQGRDDRMRAMGGSDGANMGPEMMAGPGRRLRTNIGANIRRHLDFTATVLRHLELRLWTNNTLDRPAVQPDSLYGLYTLPVQSDLATPVDCVLLKYVRSAVNKVRCPIFTTCWSPEGKRLITGASTGEFTLWNGTMFNFETILQAHDTAIRALQWSHNDNWLVSADHDGYVKYWQPNMNNVHMYQAHREAIRTLSFSPTDCKLVTGSDDATARVWDFARCTEEYILRGHGSDVRCVHWHPFKSLLATASRDSQQPVRLWDTRTGKSLATLHEHKNSVMACEWNQNGNWLLTASRDHLVKLFDIRMMRELRTFRGHSKEVTSIAWHPIHEGLFCSGGGDGSLFYWLVDNESEMGCIEHAHEQSIWSLQWHPLGHALASGSNDNSVRFWSRSKPGDTLLDFHDAQLESSTVRSGGPAPSGPATATKTVLSVDRPGAFPAAVLPGMGSLDSTQIEPVSITSVPDTDEDMLGEGGALIPGLGDGDNSTSHASYMANKKGLIKQPPAKRAQKQFERVWNVAKPMEDGVQRALNQSLGNAKKSLLGNAPNPDERPLLPMNNPHMEMPFNAMGGFGPSTSAANMNMLYTGAPMMNLGNAGPRGPMGGNGPPFGVFNDMNGGPRPPSFPSLLEAAGVSSHLLSGPSESWRNNNMSSDGPVNRSHGDLDLRQFDEDLRQGHSDMNGGRDPRRMQQGTGPGQGNDAAGNNSMGMKRPWGPLPSQEDAFGEKRFQGEGRGRGRGGHMRGRGRGGGGERRGRGGRAGGRRRS